MVTADGTKSSAVLQISAESVAPPVVSPIRLDHVRGGQPVVVDVADYVSSQLRKPQIGITNLTARGSSDVAATVDGTRITFRPGDKAVGLAEFDLEVSDSPGAPDTRRARSLISLDVFGVPEPPTNVRASASAVNGTVDLSWSPGAANGSPIEHFVVEGGPHTQECVASPCTIKGLPTDKSVSFRVRAVNEAGASDLSAPSEPITVLVRPDAMNGVAIEASGDGWLDVSWRGPSSGGKVDSYYVTWPSNHATPAASSTGTRISGLDNNQVTTVCVRAVNEAGDGPEICVDGQSAGPPDAPVWVGQTRGSASVTLAWTAVPPNGPGTVVYHVRSEPSGRSCDTSATSCVVAMSNDGSNYTFYVRAETTVGQSAEVASAPYVDAGTPEPFISVSVEPTGDNKTVTATFQAGATNGGEGTVTARVGKKDQGWAPIPAEGGWGTLTLTLSANGTPTEIVLRNCTAPDQCSYSDAQTVESYGPISAPTISVEQDGEYALFSISGEANGREGTTLFVTGNPGGEASAQSKLGSFQTETIKVFVGYGNSISVTGLLDDGVTQLNAVPVTMTIEPPPRAPKVTVLSTPATGCPNELSPCQSISVELTDFSPSTPECQVTYQDPIDTTPFEKLFTAISSPYSLGLFDGNNITIVCKDEIYGDISGSL
ncbi:fibronectin type III domain-containing protein [Nostocoides jenkinsii]|nr:fibronectin type III domain-containing protein [Tetrasphaera jenkinsii]